MLFDVQEHPERFTDEQVEALLADDNVKQFAREMAEVRMGVQAANPKDVDVDEAWKTFAARNELAPKKTARPLSIGFKIAASIVGIAFLSGIAYAAVSAGLFRSSSTGDAAEQAVGDPQTQVNVVPTDSAKAPDEEKTDSVAPSPVVFDNATLGEVLARLADFYHVKVQFESNEAQNVRIYFNWDKTKTLQKNVDILNAFDRIDITYSPSLQTLNVK